MILKNHSKLVNKSLNKLKIQNIWVTKGPKKPCIIRKAKGSADVTKKKNIHLFIRYINI